MGDMKILITEIQYNRLLNEINLEKAKLFFRRNYDDLVSHLFDIIWEGIWHSNMCDYKDFKVFYDMLVEGSVDTFIYSYDELGGYNDSSMREFLMKFTKEKFGNYIKEQWREKECE